MEILQPEQIKRYFVSCCGDYFGPLSRFRGEYATSCPLLELKGDLSPPHHCTVQRAENVCTCSSTSSKKSQE